MEDTRMMILDGGRTLCGRFWSESPAEVPGFHKLYFPVSGTARVAVDDHETALTAARILFLPGRHRIHPLAAESLDLYWLHFRPLAVNLDYALSRHSRAVSWPRRRWAHWQSTIQSIPQACRENDVPTDLRVQAMLHEISADLLTRPAAAEPARTMADRDMERLMPAVHYMDTHATRNPPLADVARRAHLSPGHFHRLFRRVFGLTPHAYMERQRMALAHRLLTRSAMTVGQVAQMTGYDSPYYFSRAFGRFYGSPPRDVRDRKETDETVV